ncbi:hypothetical protein KM043_006372 [Ampulex compressa]|nr:hypothetical protein KM043_006372 [Ampulex compressa]
MYKGGLYNRRSAAKLALKWQFMEKLAPHRRWPKRQSVCSPCEVHLSCGSSCRDSIDFLAWTTVCLQPQTSKSWTRRFEEHEGVVVNTCSELRREKMAPTRVILMSCGSYNPPTNMHLRMFEIARDHLHRMGTHMVVGGVISPVHDAYAKKELASATQRCAMLKLALQNSDWIRLSTWETRQNDAEDMDWIPENIKNNSDDTPIQIKLLCGADLLESFGTYDLWAEEDIDAIVGEHGLVVITREGSNPNKFIYDSDILSKHMHNIYIVTEWIPNEVSSTKIRRALKRGESVRYLVQDSVIDYVYKNGIYGAKTTTTSTPIKLELISPNANNYLTINSKYHNTFLTPSPSDVTMESPSPIEIISIDVPDTVLRKNIQNATSVSSIVSRHGGLEEAREKFISVLVAENGNAKHISAAKAAYPGLAKQIIATETGESQILDEVGFADDDRKVRKVVRVQPCPGITEHASPDRGVVVSSEIKDTAKVSVKKDSSAEQEPEKVRPTLEENSAKVGLDKADKGSEEKPSISSTEFSATSAAEDSGRYECALSDFSVDKEDYRLRRYGLEEEGGGRREALEEPVNNFRSKASGADTVEENRVLSLVPRHDVVGSDDRKYDNKGVLDPEDFPSDNARCSNRQVLVLVSAMIHGNLEKESAALIVTDNENRILADIAADNERLDKTNEKISLIVQSPLPSSISEESTVRIQEITDEDAQCTEEKSESSVVFNSDTKPTKRDLSREIDGKYLKSIVNSRKSPRKSRSGHMRIYSNDNELRGLTEELGKEESVLQSSTQEEVFQKSAKTRAKSPKRETRSTKSKKATSDAKCNEATQVSTVRKSRRYDATLKGSLDSVITASEPKSGPRRKSRTPAESFSKKSKSYESIKRIQEVYLEEPTKTDSTSQLITANEFDVPTDEFCSVCCYANEMSLRTDGEIGSPNQETFYTLRSNCSSFGDEDSTECDICSSCNLQESTDGLDRKILATAIDVDPLCEVCEICGEMGAAFDPNQEAMLSAMREQIDFADARTVDSPYILMDSFRLVDGTTTDPSLDEDSFEIENCGFQSGTESADDRGLFLVDGDGPKSSRVRSVPPIAEKPREKSFVPKDEVAVPSSGSRRLTRKGSLLRKTIEDAAGGSQDKRRYSSVDNLQLAKMYGRGNDKVIRLKSNKLIGSADNIRTSRSSRRCKSLQRSADNVRYLDSSTDNLDSLVESLGKEDEMQGAIEWGERPKIRDNETVKMILTKHGIKIISEKETAL